MLKDIKNTITLLLFVVALDNGATINIDEMSNEITHLINGRQNIDELTFDELINIVNILKQYIINAA